MHLKMSSAKWRPFCLGLNVLIHGSHCHPISQILYSAIKICWVCNLHLYNLWVDILCLGMHTGCHFAKLIFKHNFLNENNIILIIFFTKVCYQANVCEVCLTCSNILPVKHSILSRNVCNDWHLPVKRKKVSWILNLMHKQTSIYNNDIWAYRNVPKVDLSAFIQMYLIHCEVIQAPSQPFW